jgi:multisubunit Na+/H+ antiporter MnhE subunit
VRFIWENVVGLVIEDSQLAIGIVVALAITWALSTLGGSVEAFIGWLLLVMLVLVLLGNLVVTARRAKRRLA